VATIHLIGGEKGGVGKSVLARLLTQYMIDHEIAFSAFDSDQSHGALQRFYQDYSKSLHVNVFESMDKVIEQAVERPDEQIIVDLAAQTARFLNQWVGESGVTELTEDNGITLKYWHVMDSGHDSVQLLETLMDTYGSTLDYVIILNQVRGDDFSIFQAHPARETAESFGATLIPLKRLHPPLMNKIDSKSASFWAAANWKEGADKFSLMERQRVKIWLRGIYNSFDNFFNP